MTNPTITNFFGANATVLTEETLVTASGFDPVLLIRASDFASWANPGLASDNPQKWLTNIMNFAYQFFQVSANLSDESINCVVTLAFVTLADRIVGSTTTRKRQFSYAVDIYAPDAGSNVPDPDDI
jgi:hypothetical protein